MVARALLVGVPSTDLGGFPDLPDAPNDVAEVRTLLTDNGFPRSEIVERGDGLAVREAEATLLELRRATGAGDLTVVYFSCHGYRGIDTSPEPDEVDDEHLVLTDGLLADDWFHDFWEDIQPGSRWVTVADCCYSATAMLGINPFVAAPAPVVHRPSLTGSWRLHLAAAPDDRVTEVAGAQPGAGAARSYLTVSMLRILREAPTSSYRELMDAVQRRYDDAYCRGMDLGRPVKANVSVDERLLDSPAFRPLEW